MANFEPTGAQRFIKATGTGTDADPFVIAVDAEITVTDALTDAELRASPVPVSGNIGGTVTTTATRYSYTSAAGTVVGGTAIVDIIAAPGAGTALYVIEEFAQNPYATASTIIFYAGTVVYRRLTCQNQGDGLFAVHPAGMERVLPDNTALKFNVSAGTIDYSFRYRTVKL